MKKDIWLKISGKKSGYKSWAIGQVQAFTKGKPATKSNEIAVKLSLEIPDKIFEETVFEVRAKLPEVEPGFVEALASL